MIKAHENRPLHSTWKADADCTFCRIINRELPASVVYEDEQVIAFLGASRYLLVQSKFLHASICPTDILPLRPGHTLVIPKAHIARLSELPPDLAGEVGKTVSKVAHALTEGRFRSIVRMNKAHSFSLKALSNTGLNVVCNQEYAQAVHHVSIRSRPFFRTRARSTLAYIAGFMLFL